MTIAAKSDQVRKIIIGNWGCRADSINMMHYKTGHLAAQLTAKVISFHSLVQSTLDAFAKVSLPLFCETGFAGDAVFCGRMFATYDAQSIGLAAVISTLLRSLRKIQSSLFLKALFTVAMLRTRGALAATNAKTLLGTLNAHSNLPLSVLGATLGTLLEPISGRTCFASGT